MKQILLSLAVCSISFCSLAQVPRYCGTDEERQRLIREEPGYLEYEATLQREIQELMRNNASERDGMTVYTIPIVFHVLHLRGTENISNEQIIDAVRILNIDYRKLNADTANIIPGFRPLIGDAYMQFSLPTIDSLGRCTNGIDRIMSVETFRGIAESKLDPWPRDKYLNVWVAKGLEGGAAGYFTGFPSIADGVMILQGYVGSIENGDPFTSRALTHEVGHFFSLAHPWGGNVLAAMGPPGHMQAECGDDGVEDTPLTRGWNTCPGFNGNGGGVADWADCDVQSFNGLTYKFDQVTTGSGATDPTPLPVVMDTTQWRQDSVPTALSTFTAVGASSNSTASGRFAFKNWDIGANDHETDYTNLTGSINTSKYYQFTITPNITDMLSVNSISFRVSRNATGMRTFAVRSSVNNYASNLPISGNGDTLLVLETGNVMFYDTDTTLECVSVTVDPAATGFERVLNPITFRLYAWNTEDAEGTFEVDSVTVNGVFGLLENVQNYMDYSYCNPGHMFTLQQCLRMRNAADSPTSQRDVLWSEANLIATGVADGHQMSCAPQADFYAQVGTSPSSPVIPFTPTACTGANVQFHDNSSLSFPTGWSWTFQDGTPSTSTLRNPVVTFDQPGWKTVTLTASNANGSTTKTDEYAVLIGNSSSAVGPFWWNFEEEQGTPENLYPFFAANYEGNYSAFTRYTGGGHSGTACALLNSGDRNQLDFIDPANATDIDELITPLLDLTGQSGAVFSFYYAYSTTTSVDSLLTEKLEIYSSTDCGRTWQPRSTISGTDLVTNGNDPDMPPALWQLKSISIPTSVQTSTVRFRLRFTTSEYSGNLFIDDINIGTSVVGMDALNGADFMTVFPNPTNDQFTLQVSGMDAQRTEVSITDLRGAVVFANVYQPMGGAPIQISSRGMGLSEGMYMLRASNAAGSSVQKLMVGR